MFWSSSSTFYLATSNPHACAQGALWEDVCTALFVEGILGHKLNHHQ